MGYLFERLSQSTDSKQMLAPIRNLDCLQELRCMTIAVPFFNGQPRAGR